MTTTLITGATGFIGRHLAAALTGQHYPALALMRRPERLHVLRAQVDALGGNGKLVIGVAGDLDLPGLGLRSDLPQMNTVVHFGAHFAWGLNAATARRTNVDCALALAELARRHGARMIMISGFMLENTAHFRRLGISPEYAQGTD